MIIHGTGTCTAVPARERIERTFRRTNSSSCFTKIVKNNFVQMDTCSLSTCKAPCKDLMDLLHMMKDLMKDLLHLQETISGL